MTNIEKLESFGHRHEHNINMLTDLCHGFAKDAGWHDKPREVGTDLILIVSELSEAMEGVRKDLMDDHLPHRKMFEVEIADAIIRCLDAAGKYNLDVGAALIEKLKYNTQRKDHKKGSRDGENGKKF